MATILDTIVARKHEEVAAAKSQLPLEALQLAVAALPPCRNFANALSQRITRAQPAVIAEVKKASPSKGLLRADFDPVVIARQYQAAGAAAISVLTDRDFFQGSLDDLRAVRAAVDLPLLRKDFMVDPYQIWQARQAGADAILLIAACLTDAQMRVLAQTACGLGLTVICEIHDEPEADRALALWQTLTPSADVRGSTDLSFVFGINNRNLHTFETRLETSIRLKQHLDKAAIPPTLVVSESGIDSPADLKYLRASGLWGYLVGEALIRQPHPGEALRHLLVTGAPSPHSG